MTLHIFHMPRDLVIISKKSDHLYFGLSFVTDILKELVIYFVLSKSWFSDQYILDDSSFLKFDSLLFFLFDTKNILNNLMVFVLLEIGAKFSHLFSLVNIISHINNFNKYVVFNYWYLLYIYIHFKRYFQKN